MTLGGRTVAEWQETMSEREFMDWMAFDELQRRPVEPRPQTLAEQKAQFQLARSDVRSRRGS